MSEQQTKAQRTRALSLYWQELEALVPEPDRANLGALIVSIQATYAAERMAWGEQMYFEGQDSILALPQSARHLAPEIIEACVTAARGIDLHTDIDPADADAIEQAALAGIDPKQKH